MYLGLDLLTGTGIAVMNGEGDLLLVKECGYGLKAATERQKVERLLKLQKKLSVLSVSTRLRILGLKTMRLMRGRTELTW